MVERLAALDSSSESIVGRDRGGESSFTAGSKSKFINRRVGKMLHDDGVSTES